MAPAPPVFLLRYCENEQALIAPASTVQAVSQGIGQGSHPGGQALGSQQSADSDLLSPPMARPEMASVESSAANAIFRFMEVTPS